MNTKLKLTLLFRILPVAAVIMGIPMMVAGLSGTPLASLMIPYYLPVIAVMIIGVAVVLGLLYKEITTLSAKVDELAKAQQTALNSQTETAKTSPPAAK